MRSNETKRARNRSLKSNLKTLEKKMLGAVDAGDPQTAAAALSRATSALDRAAKVGVIHKATASRKKSRLALKVKVVA